MHWNSTNMDITPPVLLQEHASSSLFRPSDYSKIVSVQFMHSMLHVHEHLLEQFTSPLQRDADGTVQLRVISDEAGHVIVHYLYTGAYRPPLFVNTGLKLEDKNDALLRIALQLYVASRKHGLEALRQRVQAEIKASSQLLLSAKILQTVKETIPRPDRDDLWLQEYSKSLLRSTYSDAASLLKSDLMAAEKSEATMSMSEMFLRLMIDTGEDEKVKNLEPAVHEVENVEPITPVATLQELLYERAQLLKTKERLGKLKGSKKLRFVEIEAMPEVQQALEQQRSDEGEDSPVLIEH